MVKCWCGETDAYFSDEDDGLESGCGGSGVLHCYCGGDLCVCHNHGEVECPGCEDCNGGDMHDSGIYDGFGDECDD